MPPACPGQDVLQSTFDDVSEKRAKVSQRGIQVPSCLTFADISRLDFRGSFAARVTLEPLEYLMPGLSRGKFLSLGIFRGIRVQRDNSPQLRLS